MNKLFVTLLMFTLSLSGFAQKRYEVKSPNGEIKVVVESEDGLSYTLSKGGEELISESDIALILDNGDVWSGEGEKAKVKYSDVSETIDAPHYRTPSFSTEYNQIDMRFKKFGVIFRIYNEGAAYRLYTLGSEPIVVKDEVAEFNVGGDKIAHVAYTTGSKDQFAMAFQNIYTVNKVSELPSDKIIFLPITVSYSGERKLTITESDLENYPGMFVEPTSQSFKGVFAQYPSKMSEGNGRAMTHVVKREDFIAKIDGAKNLPWRVFAISENDTEMPTNNLVYALASENRIGDYSWVRGGQSIWEWWNDWGVTGVDFKTGINMETYKHYIDFASKNGIAYLTIDEGWYVPSSGDMFNIANGLDIKELVDYGAERGVGIVLWCVFNVLDDNLEKVCAHYSEMGVKGFKIDFLDRDDQTGVEMVYRIVEMAAKYKLVVDLHGVYKPTGMNRTYPNIINFEAVFGMEEVKWSDVSKNMPLYDVTFPFIRMMAGPIDFTPGAMRNATKKDFKYIYANPLSMGTRAHQVALYVVIDSPFTMLADNTTIYEQERESLDFITEIPTTGMDQTKILSGKMGEYIVSARQFGDDWFVGALTNWDARDIEVDFSFLEDGIYAVTLFKDGVNADRVATDYAIERFNVTNSKKMTIKAASGGGFAMKIRKIEK